MQARPSSRRVTPYLTQDAARTCCLRPRHCQPSHTQLLLQFMLFHSRFLIIRLLSHSDSPTTQATGGKPVQVQSLLTSEFHLGSQDKNHPMVAHALVPLVSLQTRLS